MERRRTTRFQLKCDVQYTWMDDLGVTRSAQAVACNISAGGVFIVCKDWPSAGAVVNLEISLPSGHMKGMVQLRGTARVVRRANDGSSSGFAVAREVGWSISRPRREFAFETR